MFSLDTPEPGIARVTIDAPERRGAIPLAAWGRLASMLRALPAETRVLLIGGRTDFSAGADLSEFPTMAGDPARVAAFRRAMREGIDALAAVPVPVVAVIAGGCFGAGMALAIAADLRIAGERARLAITPAKLGIGYPAEDVARLVALVGHGQAARMLFTADVVPAAEAAAIGLVEAVAADPWAEAMRMGRRIADNSAASTRMLKAVMRSGDADHDGAFDALFAGADLVEGLAAYRERRAARFA